MVVPILLLLTTLSEASQPNLPERFRSEPWRVAKPKASSIRMVFTQASRAFLDGLEVDMGDIPEDAMVVGIEADPDGAVKRIRFQRSKP